MSIPANAPYRTTIRPRHIADVACTCSGSTVFPTTHDNGDGTYTLHFTAAMIFCDGPLEITEGTTVLETQTLTGC